MTQVYVKDLTDYNIAFKRALLLINFLILSSLNKSPLHGFYRVLVIFRIIKQPPKTQSLT